MRLALIGSGAMGKLVNSLALDQGHEVGLILTSSSNSTNGELIRLLRGHDVAIDFSVTDAVLNNVRVCAAAGLPLVEGTTGWHKSESEVRRIVAEYDGALIFGANFSVGVNLFYRVVTRAAEIFQDRIEYAPFIEEAHHARKRDAPSGTALKLKSLLSNLPTEVPVASTRAGFIPGTHIVGFDSAADQITLQHVARSRAGFAGGALLAAKWIVGRKGVFEFSEVLDDILKSQS